MLLKSGFIGLIACILCCSTVLAEDMRGWQLKKEEDGIKIYSRKVAGSPVSEFQGIVSVKGPLNRVIQLYEDTSRVHEWMYHCKQFKEIEQAGTGKKFFYFHQELQWPVSDRDAVTFRAQQIDPKTQAVSYQITSSPDAYPVQENIVRISVFQSEWEFIPREGGMIEVRYQILLDPGGSIPKWLVNQMGVDFPFNSLKRFRELLQ